MSTYYLLNVVVLATVKHLPGELIDSTIDDTAALSAAGGVLWDSSDATVAAAAAAVTSAHSNKGLDEFQMERTMVAAAAKSLKASVDADNANAGTATLVAGTKTVSCPGMTSTSKVFITLKTPGGTTGTNVKAVPGTDQFVLTAVDTAGALVNTDTSTYMWSAIL